MYDAIIVGSGPAGYTAGHLFKSSWFEKSIDHRLF